jgi:hypothetical protein
MFEWYWLLCKVKYLPALLYEYGMSWNVIPHFFLQVFVREAVIRILMHWIRIQIQTEIYYEKISKHVIIGLLFFIITVIYV